MLVPVECGEICSIGPHKDVLPSLAKSVADPGHVFSFFNSIAGAVLGAAVILGVALLYEAVRGVEGMGQGDVKLMALIGAFLGVKLTLLVLLLGSLIGSFFGLFLILWVWMKRLHGGEGTHRNGPCLHQPCMAICHSDLQKF